jgi:hypothetical protein
MENELRNERPTTGSPEYEPPLVEQVMTPDELAREVHYAGAPVSPGQIG